MESEGCKLTLALPGMMTASDESVSFEHERSTFHDARGNQVW